MLKASMIWCLVLPFQLLLLLIYQLFTCNKTFANETTFTEQLCINAHYTVVLVVVIFYVKYC